jgi:hypothetical protein
MKTNFLNKLKQGLFLLIAVLGTFISYAQLPQNPTIGGSKTPDTGGVFDIGGKLTPPPPLLTNLKVKTQCTFVYLNEPGGTGGKGTSSDTGQIDSPDDLDDGDTGGRGTSTDTGQITYYDQSYEGDTGGKNSTGGIEIFCPLCSDTGGGNGGKSTTGEFAYFDIGGRDSGGGLNPLNDIGGRGGSDTGPGQFTIYDIGGRSTSSTGEVADTGGRGNELGGGCIFENGCMIYTPE